MLKINFDSTATAPKQDEIQRLTQVIQAKIESKNYGFLNILDNNQIIETISELENKLKIFQDKRFLSIVILGIGGSSLGIKTILRSLLPLKIRQKVYILDNIDPDYIAEVDEQIILPSTLFITISKSGQTPETISQYSYYKNKIQEASLNLNEHIIAITDPDSGYLREEIKSNNLISFNIPTDVGGRFSVLTNVGLVISYLLGIDCEKLLEGASDYLKSTNSQNEPANTDYLEYPLTQYDLAKSNHNINVLMPYSNQLEYFADWYTQLLSESIGKKLDKNNQIINVGITPLKALGSSDQHSQLQLFSEGPKDKLITFIKVNNFNNSLIIPNIDNDKLNFLNQVTFGELLNSELDATRESLTNENVPNILIEVESINEYNLGQLFVFFELTIIVLGELYNIDAFNQPGVEQSKILTKKTILDKKIPDSSN